MSDIIFKIEDFEFVVIEIFGGDFYIYRFVPFAFHFDETEILTGKLTKRNASTSIKAEIERELLEYIDLYRLVLKRYYKYRSLRVFE